MQHFIETLTTRVHRNATNRFYMLLTAQDKSGYVFFIDYACPCLFMDNSWLIDKTQSTFQGLGFFVECFFFYFYNAK